MTQIAIQKQLDAIKTVTDKALKSKEASKRVLIRAGLIKDLKHQALQASTSRVNKK